jgi:hypothetical protein
MAAGVAGKRELSLGVFQIICSKIVFVGKGSMAFYPNIYTSRQ